MILPHFTTRSLQGFLAVQTIEGLRTLRVGFVHVRGMGSFYFKRSVLLAELLGGGGRCLDRVSGAELA
jgi:hypothetical protein